MGRSSIAIHTQRALPNGEKREGFEIGVHDAESDRDKKVWINECLTRGNALHRSQDSGQSFQTLFTDDADGPLDPECKRAFTRGGEAGISGNSLFAESEGLVAGVAHGTAD